MDWENLDWKILDRLRDGFISGTAASGPYWKSGDDLAHYDATFAERIGWKWDSVIAELKRREWAPPEGPLLDWGCGSGVAGRRVVTAWGASHFHALQVWDHSPLARTFAAEAAMKRIPGLRAETWTKEKPVGTLVLSHVLNELSAEDRHELLAVIRRASAVLWVEPGTRAVGREIGALRDELLSEFSVVAPCTHRNGCPLFKPGREADWCHFFAEPPKGIYADSQWVRFGQRAGIDLRSLPFSFLVLERLPARPLAQPLPVDAGRILGRTEVMKADARWLECNARGLDDVVLPKRADPALHKKLDKRPGLSLIQTQWTEGKPSSARELFP